MGFPVPVSAWLRGPFTALLDEYVLGERASDRGLFNRDSIKNLVADHRTGARDNSQKLWALMNFELWARQAFDNEDYSVATAEINAICEQ
jgi:asparagine synthase (glutamine-hydrolysing)